MFYYTPENGHYIHTNINLASGLNDGHGGHAAEHVQMMECIANEVVDKKISELIMTIEKDAYAAAYAHLMKDLYFDVKTAVNVALDDGQKILIDQRTKQVIAKSLMDEIKKQIDGLKIKI